MSPFVRGLLAGVAQLALVGSVGAKFLFDRETYPRVWIETRPFDPELPFRGRYVRLSAVVRFEGERPDGAAAPRKVHLEIHDGALTAVSDPAGREQVRSASCGATPCWVLVEPLAYFIPEHAPDPARAHAQLWVEATLPPHGPPRPIRLALKEGGRLSPLPGDGEAP